MLEPGLDEPAAASDGIDPIEGVGLFMTGGAFWSGTRAKLASVAMLEADILLAGLAGRPPTGPWNVVNGDGDGIAAAEIGVPIAVGGLLPDCFRGMAAAGA